MSCATLSAEPLVRGAWLKKGAHVDLVGAFTPKMREADDAAVRRARVYVDIRATAPKGSGDIAIPLKKKIIKLKDIQGDLFELCRGKAKGRKRKDEITLFKSIGIAHRGSGRGDAGVAAAEIAAGSACRPTLECGPQDALEPRPSWPFWSKSAA